MGNRWRSGQNRVVELDAVNGQRVETIIRTGNRDRALIGLGQYSPADQGGRYIRDIARDRWQGLNCIETKAGARACLQQAIASCARDNNRIEAGALHHN